MTAILSAIGYVQAAGSAFGIFTLLLIIFFFGPSMGIDGWYPLASLTARLVAIGLVLLIALGVLGFWAFRRRRAARKLEKGITAPISDDGKVLSERLKDALETLKRARGTSGDYLYSIPWYMVIGPPGAGKTTALVNSGLKFPLLSGGGKAMVEGTGGTRYCDWWFAEDAIIIDTAGRYTTQDTGSASADEGGEGDAAKPEDNLDRRSWLAFLDLLRKNRRKQPINGVIVAISLDDLVNLSDPERNAHADAIRTRLVELYDRLKVAFPVYVMFTKADLVSGFNEFFGDLREHERRMVWGATFQTEDRTRNTVSEVAGEFDALVLRLSETMVDRLQSEPNQARRSLVLGFPAQFDALREHVTSFLNRVFEPTRYHSNAILRGFYFTSGTQEGTAFDQLIGATGRDLGISAQAQFSGQGRSYFLFDLLKKVVFAEAGWVSYNRAAVRRDRLVRGFGLGTLAVIAAAGLTAFAISYFENERVIADMDASIEEYRIGASAIADEDEITSPDLADANALLLYPLRTLPVGYETREEAVPLNQQFGLSQQARLLSASEEAYRRTLERSFRSRLILRLEERLQQNLDDPEFVYEALKVYRMLGGDRPDDDLIVEYLAEDWEENVYPGRLNQEGREALKAHLRAMLDLDRFNEPLVGLNAPLVAEAEAVLARQPLVDLAFARMKLEANADPTLFSWVFVDAAGSDAERVFALADGGELDTLAVAPFYTFEGFQKGLLQRLATIEEDMENERWLLGKAGEQRAVQDQYTTLKTDLINTYNDAFITAWRELFSAVVLRQMVADKPNYTALGALSSPASPLRQLLASVREETLLTADPPAPAEGEEGDGPSGPGTLQQRQAVEEALADVRVEPGLAVATEFAPLHQLVAGADGAAPPVESIISAFGDLQQRLITLALGRGNTEEASAAIEAAVTELRATAVRTPEPVSRWIISALNDIEAEITGAAIARLAQSFNNQVTRQCEAVVTNRYPFFESDRGVPLADFERVFGPNGLFDTFYKEELSQFVDDTGPVWAWRTDTTLEGNLSDDTLRQFQRAALIREAFFSDEAEGIDVGFLVTALSLDPTAKSGTLKINRNAVAAGRIRRSQGVKWPGENPDNVATAAIAYGLLGQVDRMTRRGPWSLWRLLDATNAVAEGDTVVANFRIGGRSMSFEIASDTLRNPLTLQALREFRCPKGL